MILFDAKATVYAQRSMKQKYTQRPDNFYNEAFFVEKGFSQGIARLLSARGILPSNYSDYFENSVCRHSPFDMPNMDQAVETINCLADSGGSVLVYGDYDADGLTASSILWLYFKDNGIDCDVVIPSRDEGYGLHTDKVVRAFQRKYYDLIITVDCGISNAAEVEEIQNELGVEVIVTDHHELPAVLPNCICVNPKMGYPFPYLAGAGVAYKLIEAMAGTQVADKYACLAAIGTIGDLMPMTDENRTIVKVGLDNFNHKTLRKLAEIAKCSSPVTAMDVAMRIAPRINAAGRVGSPSVALAVLQARDKADIKLIEQLQELNEQRKEMLEDIVVDADQNCDFSSVYHDRLVFLHSDYWQHGLLGIVASRYKEKFNLPTVVMTKDGNNYVGSARSVDGVDIFQAFSSAQDLLVKFGGHKASVGFTVAKENLSALKERFSEYFSSLPSECFEKTYTYDVEIGADATAEQIFKLSQLLQPMLPQDKIICRVKGNVKFANSFGKDAMHLSVTLDSGLELKGFFRFGKYASYIKNGAVIDVVCSLEKDTYTGNVTGIIEDMTLCNSLCYDEYYQLNLLKNFCSDAVDYIDESQVESLLENSSVCVVFDDFATFLQTAERFDFSDFVQDVFFPSNAKKTVVVSPLATSDFSSFENVLCFVNDGFVRKYTASGVKYFCVTPSNSALYALEVTRKTCADVFEAIKNKGKFDSLRAVYDKYLTSKLSYAQFCVAIRIFEELGILTVKDKFTVKIDSSTKRDLADSYIYKRFNPVVFNA